MATALAESRRKERAVLDNALDIICSIDEMGRFSAVNPASQSVWGYTPDELIGKRLTSIVPNEEAQTLAARLSEIAQKKVNDAFECGVRKQDGTIAEMQGLVHPSADEKSLFCVAHDVSERKKLEQMKRDFIAMVSHDLKTPLSSIQMVHSLLAAGAYGTL